MIGYHPFVFRFFIFNIFYMLLYFSIVLLYVCITFFFDSIYYSFYIIYYLVSFDILLNKYMFISLFSFYFVIVIAVVL